MGYSGMVMRLETPAEVSNQVCTLPWGVLILPSEAWEAPGDFKAEEGLISGFEISLWLRHEEWTDGGRGGERTRCFQDTEINSWKDFGIYI